MRRTCFLLILLSIIVFNYAIILINPYLEYDRASNLWFKKQTH